RAVTERAPADATHATRAGDGPAPTGRPRPAPHHDEPHDPGSAPLLEARALAAAPAGVREPVVRDVSLALAAGEWLALTGPNGCGRAARAPALAGGRARGGGRVALGGRPIGPGDPPAARAPVSVILQDPANQLLQGTVFDEVRFAARNLGHVDADSKAAELI